MASSSHVKKGDTVLVTTGAEDRKGKTGVVLAVLPKKNQVIVEGVNFIKKHTKKSQTNPNGGIFEREGPIHISNVRLAVKPVKDTKEKQEPEETKAKAAPKKRAKSAK